MRNFFLADYPERSQMLFQDPASPVMEGIIDFHHDLTGLLIWIGLFVLWMTASALLRFKSFSPAYADRRHAHFAKVFTYFSGSPLYRFVRYASFPLLTLPAWRNYYVMRVT
jgi:cytochrome c oxidase subunit 2